MKRKRLIEYRVKRSQTEIAKLYGVTQQAWEKWENGKSIPRVKIMKQLEVDSGISMEKMFFDVFYNNKKL